MADTEGDPELVAERGQFRAEYERELGQWLRRRLGYLCIAYTVFQILSVTALTLSSTVFSAPPAEPALPPRVEQRAEEAERRAEAGLPLRPVDARALAALEAEKRRLEREQGAQAVVSTLDAFSMIARDFAEDLSGARERPKRARPAQERMIDRWWLDDAPGGGAAVARPDDAPIATMRGASTPQDADQAGSVERIPARGSDERDAADSSAEPGVDVERGDDEVEAATAEMVLPWWLWVLTSLPTFAVVAWFGLRVRPRLYTRAELVSAASRMILSLGLLNFGFECGMLLANPDAPILPLFTIFYWHLTASLFLPWSWRESLKPIVPLLACWLLLRLGLATSEGAWLGFAGALIGTPFLFAPALFLCYARLRWHQRRFKSGFVGRRFLEMRREFIQARAVHESLFPKPEDHGWLRFDFGYRPAADIGGDFIHTWTDDNDRFHLALIDVTGHGLASAMTVARIHGEIERLRDEHPDDGPARMLSRLNRYFQRLLSRYRLFATAVLITVDPRTGEMRYASAGHPPVFIRSRNGTRELESTTFLLGAVDNATFGEEEISIYLEEGDRVVLFTDGAYDAKSPRGERFGLDRLREILRRPAAPASWTHFLMNLVETFEAGMPEDDLLIAEVCFRSRKSVSSSVTGDDLPVPRANLAGARN
ncbi:MAG: Phosphoserine phosphatase RsbP [Planctomycetota bacterium]|jgi:hypothetical protein